MLHTIQNPYKATSVTFTGHRPSKLCPNGLIRQAYQADFYQNFIPDLTKCLEQYLNIGMDTFITGGAQGFDQLVFLAVEELKQLHPGKTIRNVVYVPFEGQENAWKDDGIFGRSSYQSMLAYADHIEYCTDVTSLTADKKTIVQALDYRNHCMCDNAARLCALWHKAEYQNHTLNPSGTKNCWDYAKSIAIRCDKIVYDFDEHNRICILK